MSLWEKHQKVLYVCAGFLLLLGLMWLIALRGHATERDELDRKYDAVLKGDITKLCNPQSEPEVSQQQSLFKNANALLDKRFTAMKKRLDFSFPKPLIPVEKKSRPQSYVRTELRILRDNVSRELSTKRNIEMSDDAASLGMELPLDQTESVEQDEKWLRQMVVIKRFVEMLQPLAKDENDVQLIMAIDSLAPLEAHKTGKPDAFMREHPIECTMLVTFDGLVAILEACDKAETFHVVRSIDMQSLTNVRRTDVIRSTDKDKKRIQSYAHYYRVQLRVACLEVLEGDEVEMKKSSSGPRVKFTPIPH